MDTKLKADISELAVTVELLKRGFNVLKPVGDRLAYDLAVDAAGKLIRVQVKAAWYNSAKDSYFVDVRRTKTNRRRMKRSRYSSKDFDFAIIHIQETGAFYILPMNVFNSFSSTIGLVESEKRQRKPRSTEFKDCWQLLRGGWEIEKS